MLLLVFPFSDNFIDKKALDNTQRGTPLDLKSSILDKCLVYSIWSQRVKRERLLLVRWLHQSYAASTTLKLNPAARVWWCGAVPFMRHPTVLHYQFQRSAQSSHKNVKNHAAKAVGKTQSEDKEDRTRKLFLYIKKSWLIDWWEIKSWERISFGRFSAMNKKQWCRNWRQQNTYIFPDVFQSKQSFNFNSE